MNRTTFIPLVLLLIAGSGQPAYGQRYTDFTTPTPLPRNHTLILGILGGRQDWDSEKRNVRKLALKLRQLSAEGLHVETLENRRLDLAVRLIHSAFDQNRDDRLDARECAEARLILYGHSFGGAAVVRLARRLQKSEIPVLLTVQVDSVGMNDEVIPANVLAAANLFQRDGLIIKGEKAIRPADPMRTKIVGNFAFTYANKKIDLAQASWYERSLMRAHTKMEFDTDVWAQVEEMIVNAVRGWPGRSF